MTENEIVAKVRAIMNEAGEEESLTLLSEDNIKLDTYIKSSIPDAVSIVALNSPVKGVNVKEHSNAKLIISTDGNSGTVDIPSDFILLRGLKISSWKRIISELKSISSEEYKYIGSGYQIAGLNHPMCFESWDSDGKVIEFYAKGMKTEDVISVYKYEAQYKSSDGLKLDSGDSLAQAVCYMTASLVYAIFENYNTSKSMQETAINLIPK